MPPVHIQPADRVPLSALAAALNRAYSDYYFPIYVSPASLRAMLERDDIALVNCAVALDDGEVVGTGLLGVRGKSGWIGGMGVVPRRRHQGIGRRVLRHLIARARALGVQTLRLEVIEENTPAHALYAQHGFRERRYLHLLERSPAPADPTAERSGFVLKQETPQMLLAHYEAFHHIRNCWQRDLPSLERLAPQCQGWMLYDGDTEAPTGYVLGQLTSHDVLVFDLAVDTRNPRHSLHATALLTHLHHHAPHAISRAYNVAEDDPALNAYHSLDYQTHLRQIEMELTLS